MFILTSIKLLNRNISLFLNSLNLSVQKKFTPEGIGQLRRSLREYSKDKSNSYHLGLHTCQYNRLTLGESQTYKKVKKLKQNNFYPINFEN